MNLIIPESRAQDFAFTIIPAKLYVQEIAKLFYRISVEPEGKLDSDIIEFFLLITGNYRNTYYSYRQCVHVPLAL